MLLIKINKNAANKNANNNNAANNNTANNNVATKLISHATSAVLDIQSALISTGNQNRHNSDTGGLG